MTVTDLSVQSDAGDRGVRLRNNPTESCRFYSAEFF